MRNIKWLLAVATGATVAITGPRLCCDCYCPDAASGHSGPIGQYPACYNSISIYSSISTRGGPLSPAS